MDELPAAERDADVRRSSAHGFEEHEITRLHVVMVDLPARVVLLPCFTRQRGSVLREYPLDQPAAVEPLRRLAAAISILRALERQRRGNDVRCDYRSFTIFNGGRLAT